MARPTKYGFADLQVGEAFDVKIDEVNYGSLSAYKSAEGRRLNRNFSLRTIREEGVYEISRLPGGYKEAAKVSLPEIKKARPR